MPQIIAEDKGTSALVDDVHVVFREIEGLWGAVGNVVRRVLPGSYENQDWALAVPDRW